MSNRIFGHIARQLTLKAEQTLAGLWPRACFVCGEQAGNASICDACAVNLPYLSAAHCPVCALPSPSAQTCGRCLRRAPYFDATRAVFIYAHPLREILLAFKAGAGFHIAGWLADTLVIERSEIKVDCIVPVPLHDNRLAERGFNQSLELARGLARDSGWPLLKHAVLRDVDTPHQTGLRLKARQRNVRGAFRCVQRFDGLHVLVVDDVMTSGSSLNELARTLKLAGASTVTNLVVARTLAKFKK